MVEGETLVFKVFTLKRVQQRCVLLRNAFLSGLWSRSLISQLVEAYNIFRPRRSSSSSSHVPARVPEALDEPGQGFFRTFPKILKSAKSGSHSTQRVPASFNPSTPAPQQRVRLKEWMILDEHGLYFWNMDTEERRWQMEEGLNPRWWLRDGQYVDLGDN